MQQQTWLQLLNNNCQLGLTLALLLVLCWLPCWLRCPTMTPATNDTYIFVRPSSSSFEWEVLSGKFGSSRAAGSSRVRSLATGLVPWTHESLMSELILVLCLRQRETVFIDSILQTRTCIVLPPRQHGFENPSLQLSSVQLI